MHVTDDHNREFSSSLLLLFFFSRPCGSGGVDTDAVGLLVENVGGGKEEAVEGVDGEEEGEGGRGEVLRVVVERRGEGTDPLAG